MLQHIQSYLNDMAMTEDELDDLRYTYHMAEEAIRSWKAHQLRSVRQDRARTDILDILDDSSVLITQDWAMKFLSQKYRESQSDWFGKRGISLHISVAARKNQGKLQSQSFVHVVENCDQDSFAVVRTIKVHVRRFINEGHDVQTALDFKEAMLSNGGIEGTRIVVVDASTVRDSQP